MATLVTRTLPPDSYGQNADRAEGAASTIRHFQTVTGTDWEDGVTDLLADLMHFCDRNDFDWGEELGKAWTTIGRRPISQSPPRPRSSGATTSVSQLAVIIQTVEAQFRLEPRSLTGRGRTARIAFVRQVAIFIGRHVLKCSYPAIAAAVGRDHSTVIHGFDLIRHRAAHDRAFMLFIENLETQIIETFSTTADLSA
jgi:hypothetical protein